MRHDVGSAGGEARNDAGRVHGGDPRTLARWGASFEAAADALLEAYRTGTPDPDRDRAGHRVRPTLRGVRTGRDEVVERAIQCIRTGC